MRTRVFSRVLVSAAVTGSAGLGLAVLGPAASAAAPAKPYDFNGDGYRDLAIGSPNGKVGRAKGAGFLTVTYGSRGGLNLKKRQILSQDTSGVPGAAEAGDHFGHALASGDLNRDGRADLVVSAPDEDGSGKKNNGLLVVFWGTKSGLSTRAFVLPANDSVSNERTGLSVAVGDFNRGGYADLAYTSSYGFGWYGFEPTAASAAVHHRMSLPGRARAAAPRVVTAAVYAGDVLGKGHPQLVLTWRDPASTEFRNDVSVWAPKTSNSLTVQSSVPVEVGPAAVADFDGDRHADIAIGQRFDAGHRGGQVTVLKGSAAGIARGAQYSIGLDSAGVPGTSANGNRFGADVAVGDANKDGKADLAVGAPGVTIGSARGAGAALVLFGRATGLGGAQWVSQSTSGVPGGSESNDAFGSQVSLLDHNRDGYADLTVGAPTENRGEGTVTLIKGRASGVVPISGAFAFGPGSFKLAGKTAQLGLRLGD
ncbi:FG-GAP-like repeat-containing protein [Spirillospora sp. NPDC048911]|uniref:FG-GAP-like repeat-containing protein n=1 Tax=Spirillospora sp. NPDC048911 TaxID=3364527 RepID=UPI0037146CFA